MPNLTDINISLTETSQFRRLVEFLRDTEDYARLIADENLMAIVETCHKDLQTMFGEVE